MSRIPFHRSGIWINPLLYENVKPHPWWHRFFMRREEFRFLQNNDNVSVSDGYTETCKLCGCIKTVEYKRQLVNGDLREQAKKNTLHT